MARLSASFLIDEDQTMIRGIIVLGKHTELTSKAILKWANDNKVAWHSLDPGKPQPNCFIEPFNGSLRGEGLNKEICDTLAEARRILPLWRYDDTTVRPHSSLGNKTPTKARRAFELFDGTATSALATPGTDDNQTRGLSLSTRDRSVKQNKRAIPPHLLESGKFVVGDATSSSRAAAI